MNAAQMKLLRDSYNVKVKGSNNKESTAGEYMRFISDCGIEATSSIDKIIPDDTNNILHCITVNDDMISQANFPVKIISIPYEDIHAVETVMSVENFKAFINAGFISAIADPALSEEKKKYLINWSTNEIKLQALQETKTNNYYGNDDTVIIPKAKEPVIAPDRANTNQHTDTLL